MHLKCEINKSFVSIHYSQQTIFLDVFVTCFRLHIVAYSCILYRPTAASFLND